MAESGKKPMGRSPKAPRPPVVAGAAPVAPVEAPPPSLPPPLPSRPPPIPTAAKPSTPAPAAGAPPPTVTADTDILSGGVRPPNASAVETRVGSVAGLSAVPTVGDHVGKYVVDRLIGSGGMGLVVAARHEALGELVAIKLLRPKAAGDKVHAERFAREARAIIKIKSEHVVRVLDAGTLESGAPYIVMEYLVGRDLGQILRDEGPMHPARAADLMLQVCEAVASAHAVSVVHRDLKPSNFFVTQRADGTTLLKVLDFGISKAMGQEGVVDPNLTETQAVFGSPTYMSPEQIRSAKHVDHRSDIWSLGVGLYEMLCGKLPFAADNVAGLLASIVADPPFFPRGFAPHLPQGLEDLLLDCLQKDPKQRVQSVVDLALRLAPFATQNVETHNLVERIQRLATKAAAAQAGVSPLQGGAGSTTGPKLAQASYTHLPPASGAPMGPGWQSNVAQDSARSSGVTFGSTGMDLSAEAPPQPQGRSLFAAVAIGLGLAVVILGGFGAYHLGTQRPMATTSIAPPEAAPIVSVASAAPPQPATSTTSPATSDSATPVVATSAKPVVSVKKSTPKHPITPKVGVAAGGSTAPKPDPTNDRF